MKTKTTYQQVKADLKEIAYTAKMEHKNDLPAIRMIINDSVDMLCKVYQFTDYYRNLLSNYACFLHPKQLK